MEQEINVNEIVKIESMAVIKSQLDKVEAFIDEKTKDIPKVIQRVKKMSFIEQEDEKKDIKKYQQYLSNLQKQLEDKRKEIKKEINKPYEEFNEYYTNGVFTKLDNGIKQIKEVVNEIEDLQKDEKRLELYDFAMEYFVANNIQDIVTFDDIGLNITISASMSSLKDQIINYCEKVKQDLELIKMEEYRDEILYEYKKNHNFAESKLIVVTRNQEIKRIAEEVQEIKKQEEEHKKVEQKVEEALEMPEIPEEIETWAFTIKATKTQVKKLKAFLDSEGVEYE